MYRHLPIIAATTLLCSVALADDSTVGDIDIFFGLDDYGIDVYADPNFCGHSNQVPVPALSPGVPDISYIAGAPAVFSVYIWANIDLYDEKVWEGMGLDFAITGDAAIVDGELYNQNMGLDCAKCQWDCFQKYRWSDGYDPNEYYGPPCWRIPMSAEGTLEGSNPAAQPWINYLGLMPRWGDVEYPGEWGDPLAGAYLDDVAQTWCGTYLLGRIDIEVSGPATVNMGISDNLITRVGDPWNDLWGTVAFGLNSPVAGSVAGAGLDNPAPDLIVRSYQRGDLNCDGFLNNGDVDPFVMALTNPAVYVASSPGCAIELADMNGDGSINNGDIDAFVALLSQ